MVLTVGTSASEGSSTRRDPRILVFYDKPEEFLPRLSARFQNAQFFSCTRYNDLPHALQAFKPQIVLAAKFEPKPFPRAAILDCPSLQWLSVAFAGVDHVVPWDDNKITVTNASGVAAEEMAQYTLAAIFGLFQRFPFFARRQFEKRWDYQLIRSATDATIGLVGLGHTGEAIARLCRSVGLKVVACRSSDKLSENVEKIYPQSELHAMLSSVDAAVICTALTPETRNLIDHKAIAAMKPGSYLINIARGPIVVEDALIDALKTDHLGGAVLDVTAIEPLPESSPLWDAPNLLITPHTSSEFAGWVGKAADMFAENLEKWIAGQPVSNRVYSNRGY
jgi:phosphoglycerate dehydrogenase-like enzyme